MNTTAAANVFCIHELVTLICDSALVHRPLEGGSVSAMERNQPVRQPALLTLAQVNQMISSLALDTMWRTVDHTDGFECLDKLYSYKTWDCSQAKREFALQSYLKYLKRVKRLVGYRIWYPSDQPSQNYVCWSWKRLLSSIPIIHLQEHHRETHESINKAKESTFRVLPNLRELHIPFEPYTEPPSIHHLCLLLTPTLQSLTLVYWSRLLSSRRVLRLTNDLQSLITENCQQLLSLTLSRETSFESGSFSQFLSDFPRLVSLEVMTDRFELLPVANPTSSPYPNLTHLTINSLTMQGKDVVAQLFLDIASLARGGSLSQLSTFIFRQMFFEIDFESTSLSLDDIEPLLVAACRLQVLEVHAELQVELGDMELKRIGQIRGSTLQQLILSPCPVHITDKPASLLGIAALISQCPKLVLLGLYTDPTFNISLTFSQTPLASIPSALETLIVGASPATHEQGVIAGKVLRNWFSKLRNVSSTVPSTSPYDTSYSRTRVGWNTVRRILGSRSDEEHLRIENNAYP